MSDQNNESLDNLARQADVLLDQGDLTGAYRIFEQICESDEANADAWFMKGSINGEMGHIDQAVEEIRRAIDIDPEFAEAHYNLANIYRSQGALNQAVSHLEAAVAADEGFYEAYVMLGAITGQLGQNDKCEVYSKNAVELQPDSPEANINLANVLQETGKAGEAVRYYQKAIALGGPPPVVYYMLARSAAITGDTRSAEENYRQFVSRQPESAEGWFALGLTLQDTGKPDEARAALERAIELKPDNAQAYGPLAYLHRLLGQPGKAVETYRKALQFTPDSVDLLFNLGVTLKDNAEYPSAMDCFNRILNLDPGHPGALYNIGNLLQITGQYGQAIGFYQRCLEAKRDSIDSYVGMAASYIALGRQDEAVKVCNEGLSVEPENPDILISAAAALITLGQEQQALLNARKAVQMNPDNAEARALLSTILNHMGDSAGALEAIREDIDGNRIAGVNFALAFSGVSKSIGKQQQAVEIMEKLLAEGSGVPLKSRISLHFALGKQYDSLKQYDLAMKHYREGNHLKPVSFDRQGHEQGISEHLSYFTPTYMRNKLQSPVTTDKPVFIVGMPRSGTSLIEQILSSHPQVHGAGELPEIIKMVTAMQGLLKSDKPYPACLDDISVDYLDALAEHYVAHIESLAADAVRVTDKMPGNFMNLGLIEMLFPNARIIHCRRNPIDTCLSGFFQDFSRSHPYSYNLEHLALYYNNYRKIMQHWREVITLPMLEIDYEDLVANQEQRSRELVEFCGLEWDERCINFHETQRFVGTASHDQVRQPMYRGSVERWKKYQEHIQPLIEGLQASSAG